MLKKIYHNRNELQEVNLFEDKECTQVFDFTNAKNLYIDGLNGDITPLFYLPKGHCNKQTIFTPYLNSNADLPIKKEDCCETGFWWNIITLDNITPNLSKYIPEDNAVLFLSEEDCKKYSPIKKYNYNEKGNFSNPENVNDVWLTTFDAEYNTLIAKVGIGLYDVDDDCLYRRCPESGNRIYFKKITIFLHHGTQCELQKANEVAKELKEKYGVEELNLFVLHYFQKLKDRYRSDEVKLFDIHDAMYAEEYFSNINKIITTNSTGILKSKDSNERPQVIDCFDIFQDHLNNI